GGPKRLSTWAHECMLGVPSFGVDQKNRIALLPMGWRRTSEGIGYENSEYVAVGLLAASMVGGAARAEESGPYRVTRIQLTGGEGGWDYITADPVGRHLFVARSGSAGHIGVYNLDTLEQVGDIPNVSAHGGEV